MKKILFSTLLTAMAFSAITSTPVYALNAKSETTKEVSLLSVSEQRYTLELSRWNVYNDGTHPLETTKGINDALKWASANGYTTFKIPAGTYLIAKGATAEDKSDSAAVNMVSNLTLELDDKTILQKETNGYEGYNVIYVGPNVEHAKITGGTLRGERDTHDYSKKMADWSAGTHEFGYGINIAGGEHIVVENVKIEKMTGDGVTIGGTTVAASSIGSKNVELGGLDNQGNPIESKGKVRTVGRTVTNFDNVGYKTHRNIFMWLPNGVTSNTFDVYYYTKDGTFIKADKNVRYYSGESIIPDGADYFRAVYDADSTNISVTRMTIDNAKDVTIQNNDIGYNRRQGITAGGEDVKILNNNIHHTAGTAPQSGIDIEPGFMPAKNHLIKGNTFLDNKIQVVLCYGENVVLDDNYFEQTAAITGGIGLHVHPGYKGVVDVKNNNFKGSGLTVNADNATMDNNKLTNGTVTLGGENQTFTNGLLTGSTLLMGSAIGQKVSDVKIIQDGTKGSAMSVGNQKAYIKNVTIEANTDVSKRQNLLLGTGNNETIFDNLIINDEAQRKTVLPAGTYNKALLNTGGVGINREGTYNINNSIIQGTGSLMTVDKMYGNAPVVNIKNSKLELTGNITYGAAMYIQGSTVFSMSDSVVVAKNNTNKSPIIKFGPYGYPPAQTKIFGVTLKNNELYTQKSIVAIDSTNAGVDAPPYHFENNKAYEGTFKFASKDISINNQQSLTTPVEEPAVDKETYTLELSKWNIYNDGTHPIETTQGVNEALKWAKENEYKTVKIPSGTYLIAKGTVSGDKSEKATIQMVSNMTLELTDKTILQKEANGFSGYNVIYAGPKVEHAKITGGIIRGDRDAYDASQKVTSSGYGINISGAQKVVVDNVKVEKVTGDGISIGGTTITSSSITEKYLEEGGIDENGKPIEAKGKIRSVGRTVTNFDHEAYKTYKNMYMWSPNGVAKTSTFDVYYYTKDHAFIKSDKNLRFFTDKTTIPTGADYFRVVYDASTPKGVTVTRMTLANANDVVIQNSDIGYNTRQGISVGGENVKIINNNVHHTSGSGSQIGIGIEPSFYPVKNHLIKGNTLLNNQIQILLSQGEDIVVDGNTLEQTSAIKGGVGLHIHPGYKGAVDVKNNSFKGSGLTVNAENAMMDNNKFVGSAVTIGGKNQVFTNGLLTGSSLSVGAATGQNVSDVKIIQDGTKPGALYIGENATHLKNITIEANSNVSTRQGLLFGIGNNDSVYDHLVITDEAQRGTVLPAGTYNDASLDTGGVGINRTGKYNIVHSTIKGKGSIMSVDKMYGDAPEVSITDSTLELTGNVYYGAAIYVQGSKTFHMNNSTILAKNNNVKHAPLIKFGPYGYPPSETKVFGVEMKGNNVHTQEGIIAIDTTNAGVDASPYVFEQNTIYNGTLKLATKDVSTNNSLKQE